MIVVGDINQLPIQDFCFQNNLFHLVTKPTRGKKTLDVFITNFRVYGNHVQFSTDW